MHCSAAPDQPYTPADLALSTAQNRDVYDLTRINLDRSNAYVRLDFSIEPDLRFRAGILSWNVGVLNALNKKNFYAYQWQRRAAALGVFASAEQDQMPRFPNGSVRFVF